MVVLKKLSGSTLMETLVASVVIIIVFLLSSMILNTIFSNTISNDQRAIKAKLNELQYLQNHDKITLPYSESLGDWEVQIHQMEEQGIKYIEFEAENSDTERTLVIKNHATQ